MTGTDDWASRVRAAPKAALLMRGAKDIVKSSKEFKGTDGDSSG